MINAEQEGLINTVSDALIDSDLTLQDILPALIFVAANASAQLMDYTFDDNIADELAKRYIAGIKIHCAIETAETSTTIQ